MAQFENSITAAIFIIDKILKKKKTKKITEWRFTFGSR